MSNLALLANVPASRGTTAERHHRHLQALKQHHRPVLADATPIAVRKLSASDRSALARIAALDTAPIPTGELLGAEVDGTLVAAISLVDGSVVADPFRRSTSAIELLSLRADQLTLATGDGQRRRFPSLRGRFAKRSARRGTIGSSPPGGGGRLLRL